MMTFLLATVGFILIQGLFSGIETGLVSVRRPRLEHAVKSGSKRAKIIHFLLSRPGMMLSTILVGTNICVVCASLSAKKFAESLGLEGNQVILVSVPLLTVLLLAAEIIPKNWFRQSPLTRSSLFAYPLYGFYLLFFVPSYIISALTDRVGRLFAGRGRQASSKLLMREDFRMLLRESEAAGVIDSEAASLLDNAVDFYSLGASDAMIPRKEVVSLPADATIPEALAICKERSFSMIPLLDKDAPPDSNWIGAFSMYDAIFNVEERLWSATTLRSLMKPIHCVSPKTTLGDILESSRLSSSPLLVVETSSQDGSKSHSGIITTHELVRLLFT